MTVQIKTKFKSLLALALVLLTAACAAPPPPQEREVASRADITALENSILALGPEVDPDEAARAARIAYEHTHRLAIEYEITDPPLIHNMKVNAGLRPRGLCWHWAEDMETRLALEEFETLDLHRAIANSHTRLLIDHSTVLISRRGDSMGEAIVLDPWRKGGVLFWAPIGEDTAYDWVPQQEVLQRKRERRLGRLRQLG